MTSHHTGEKASPLADIEQYAGRHSYNADGSNFSLVPHSEKRSHYQQLRESWTQKNCAEKITSIPINWSIESLKIQPKKSAINKNHTNLGALPVCA